MRACVDLFVSAPVMDDVVPNNSSIGPGTCFVLRYVRESMGGQTYAATLSRLTPAEIDAVYNAVDTDEDGALSAVRSFNATYAVRALPHRLSVFLDGSRKSCAMQSCV